MNLRNKWVWVGAVAAGIFMALSGIRCHKLVQENTRLVEDKRQLSEKITEKDRDIQELSQENVEISTYYENGAIKSHTTKAKTITKDISEQERSKYQSEINTLREMLAAKKTEKSLSQEGNGIVVGPFGRIEDGRFKAESVIAGMRVARLFSLELYPMAGIPLDGQGFRFGALMRY